MVHVCSCVCNVQTLLVRKPSQWRKRSRSHASHHPIGSLIRLLRCLSPRTRRVLIVCGPARKGGDWIRFR